MLLKNLYSGFRINCDPSFHSLDEFFASEFSFDDQVYGTLLGLPTDNRRANQHRHYGIMHCGAAEPYFCSYQWAPPLEEYLTTFFFLFSYKSAEYFQLNIGPQQKEL